VRLSQLALCPGALRKGGTMLTRHPHGMALISRAHVRLGSSAESAALHMLDWQRISHHVGRYT